MSNDYQTLKTDLKYFGVSASSIDILTNNNKYTEQNTQYLLAFRNLVNAICIIFNKQRFYSVHRYLFEPRKNYTNEELKLTSDASDYLAKEIINKWDHKLMNVDEVFYKLFKSWHDLFNVQFFSCATICTLLKFYNCILR